MSTFLPNAVNRSHQLLDAATIALLLLRQKPFCTWWVCWTLAESLDINSVGRLVRAVDTPGGGKLESQGVQRRGSSVGRAVD